MVNRLTWSVAALALVACLAAAGVGGGQQAVAPPERIVLCATADPATSAAVAWRSPSGAIGGRAQVAVAPRGGDPAAAGRSTTVQAAAEALQSGDTTFTHYSVQFAGLSPSTTYVYRVANGETWSEWFQFRTAAARAEPLRFLYFGDPQTDIRSRCSRVMRQALATTPDVRLLLVGGDLTNTASSDAEWGEWFDMAGYANAGIVNVPAAGNHQYDRAAAGTDVRRLTKHWRAQFALPLNGVPGVEESCYWFDYQGVRFVVLNSMEKVAEQALWLDRLLERNPCRWTVVMFHFPIFSGAKGRDEQELRAMWKPIFDRHRVDLVLTGHDHVYGRSNPAVGPAAGHTVYVLSVMGSKQYDGSDREWAARFGQDLQLYQVVTVDGGRLRYEARTADGALYDAFTMRKAGGRTTVTQDAGLPPEVVRPAK